MQQPSPQEITRLLLAWSNGEQTALEDLVPLVETELRRLARRHLRRERPGHLLQTTALVNEVYVRLIDWRSVQWQNRAHFFGVAARLMRLVLLEHARRRQTHKRGASWLKVSLEEAAVTSEGRGTDLIALDDALQSLAELDRRKERVVELRFFGGLSVEETAEVLKVSPRTVHREWDLARAWLYRELSRNGVE